MPLLAVGARRLEDVGQPGFDAIRPWVFLVGALVFGRWSLTALGTLTTAFDSSIPPDGPGGFGFVIVYGLGGVVFAISATALALVFLFQVSAALGQTLLPSQFDPNKYGLNPREDLK